MKKILNRFTILGLLVVACISLSGSPVKADNWGTCMRACTNIFNSCNSHCDMLPEENATGCYDNCEVMLDVCWQRCVNAQIGGYQP